MGQLDECDARDVSLSQSTLSRLQVGQDFGRVNLCLLLKPLGDRLHHVSQH